MVALVKEIGIEKFSQQFADSPARLAWLEAHFADANAELLRILLEEADNSDFSLRQWIDALIIMGHWLDSRSLCANLEDQIGFASCASAAVGAGSSMTTISGAVSDMLDEYGFERATKK
ncbi:MAG: hypothetical protein AAF065_08340 [Verrucomicrobiota bacterium]